MCLANTEYLMMKKSINSSRSEKAINKTALYEWKIHNPFQRASISLVRRAEKELKELKHSKQEPALF